MSILSASAHQAIARPREGFISQKHQQKFELQLPHLSYGLALNLREFHSSRKPKMCSPVQAGRGGKEKNAKSSAKSVKKQNLTSTEAPTLVPEPDIANVSFTVESEGEESDGWLLDLEDLDEDDKGGFPLSPLPSPPAGFVLEDGEVISMVPPEKRTLIMLDPDLQRPLECLIRRTFPGPQGLQFFVLIPLDTPIQVLRVDNKMGVVSEIDDDEVDSVFPAASFALSRKSMHLMQTGFCLTARGALCFSDDAIINLETEYGLGILGNLGEGVEICKFFSKGEEYILFTPFDPVLFVAFKDTKGEIQIAETEELLGHPAVQAAIMEEADFNNMVEEEEDVMAAMRDSNKQRAQF